uniref:ShKT domain-containing protein n=1 Tax=Panagrolaimus sp. JU765 TaxID=591449 RepID=A0AC34R2S8_9BILA
MNPLEAVEHQGGLQLTDPPFLIEVDRRCYWRNQPIGLTLKGNSTKDKFKGFVIQPIVWKGSKYGRRIGQFMRLDDNGSWQQQCFRKRDSVTHSHDEKKTQIKLWWKNDEDESQYVQFVATVVIHIKKFWVKSVLSDPIPPCRVEREVKAWTRPQITVPPPPNQFKMDTWKLFNHESAGTFPRSISSFPEEQESQKPMPVRIPITTPRPPPPTPPKAVEISGDVTTTRFTQSPRMLPPSTTSRPVFVPSPTTAAPIQQPEVRPRQKLTHIIPLPNMEVNSRHRSTGVVSPLRQPKLITIPPLNPPRTVFQQQQFRPQPQPQTPMLSRLQQINREIANRLQQQRAQNQCQDLDTAGRCFGWIVYCGQSLYMERFCRRTCRFC